MKCHNCSIECKQTSRFCGQCGHKLESDFIDINALKNNYKQAKLLAHIVFKAITPYVSSAIIRIRNLKSNQVKLLAISLFVSLIIYEGNGIYNNSKVSYVESILGYQYDFKSGEKLFFTIKNGQYYYSAKKDLSK